MVALVNNAGFELVDVRRARLLRQETYAYLAHCAQAPAGGWMMFMTRMKKLFANLAPTVGFDADENGYRYCQSWVTLVARRV